MKVKEIKENINTFTEEERISILPKLIDKMSIISKNQLMNLQVEWDTDRPFEEFIIEQNKQIIICIDCETSNNLGKIASEISGNKQLTLETEIN